VRCTLPSIPAPSKTNLQIRRPQKRGLPPHPQTARLSLSRVPQRHSPRPNEPTLISTVANNHGATWDHVLQLWVFISPINPGGYLPLQLGPPPLHAPTPKSRRELSSAGGRHSIQYIHRFLMMSYTDINHPASNTLFSLLAGSRCMSPSNAHSFVVVAVLMRCTSHDAKSRR
jgi:hypothetical protein